MPSTFWAKLEGFANAVDIAAKLVGAFLLFWGLLTFLPIIERITKGTTGTLFGQTGSVYIEVDDDGNAWINKNGSRAGQMPGSVVAINPKRRQLDELKWGDTLKVVTTGNFREAPFEDPGQVGSWTDKFPTIFKLRIGECLVFRERYTYRPQNDESNEDGHGSFGYMKASTVACGIFN